jgi:hypothetical protein
VNPAPPAEPTPEVVAAILAALEVAWPRPTVPAEPDQPGPWRFSGRWWSKPHTVRRVRPWVERGA